MWGIACYTRCLKRAILELNRTESKSVWEWTWNREEDSKTNEFDCLRRKGGMIDSRDEKWLGSFENSLEIRHFKICQEGSSYSSNFTLSRLKVQDNLKVSTTAIPSSYLIRLPRKMKEDGQSRLEINKPATKRVFSFDFNARRWNSATSNRLQLISDLDYLAFTISQSIPEKYKKKTWKALFDFRNVCSIEADLNSMFSVPSGRFLRALIWKSCMDFAFDHVGISRIITAKKFLQSSA